MKSGNLWKLSIEVDRKTRELRKQRRYIEEHSNFISGLIYLSGGVILTLFGIIFWSIL